MTNVYPWLEWQKMGSRVSRHNLVLRDCPFCNGRHLTLCLCFEDRAGRIECRTCLAQGPWVWNEEKEVVKQKAQEAWNGDGARPRASAFEFCTEC